MSVDLLAIATHGFFVTDQGAATIPAVGDVQEGVAFGSGDALTGTFAWPAETKVQSGVGYGEDETEFTGTLGRPVSIGNIFADMGVPALMMDDGLKEDIQVTEPGESIRTIAAIVNREWMFGQDFEEDGDGQIRKLEIRIFEDAALGVATPTIDHVFTIDGFLWAPEPRGIHLAGGTGMHHLMLYHRERDTIRPEGRRIDR